VKHGIVIAQLPRHCLARAQQVLDHFAAEFVEDDASAPDGAYVVLVKDPSATGEVADALSRIGATSVQEEIRFS
jgi:hypothetical protein